MGKLEHSGGLTRVALLMAYSGVIATSVTACGGGGDVELSFTGLVGDAPAACGQTYEGIGTSGTSMTLADFRLYVHDLRMVREDGTEIPVTLEQDGVWQHENVALLDFEDGTAGCENGTAELNTSIRGTVEESGPFTAVRFRLGVPFALNHADVSTAPSPLGFPSMFWNWNGGYKHLRIDGRTTGLPDGFRIHLGSTGCDGDERGNVTTCTADNRPEVELQLDPDTQGIRVDVAALLSQSNMDVDEGGMPGCMSGPTDPECEAIFGGLGLPFGGGAAGTQRLFVPTPR